jgi:hypothetical protein
MNDASRRGHAREQDHRASGSEAPAGDGRLAGWPVTCRYRYCPRCRREWPAEFGQCPECTAWLGEAPLERVEWQLAPAAGSPCAATAWEHAGTVALALRLAGAPPSEPALAAAVPFIERMLRPGPEGCHALGVPACGWLLWTEACARTVLQAAQTLRERLDAALPDLLRTLAPGSRLRWSIWADDCVLPFTAAPPGPCVDRALAARLFDVEPEDRLLVSGAIYEANRRWEHFVGVPARLRDGNERSAFRPRGRKEPSALAHARVAPLAPLVGRARETEQLDAAWAESRRASRSVAIIAPAGAGKTRLVNDWLARRPAARALCAGFSIFGGDLAGFVEQLVTLPESELAEGTLAPAPVIARIRARMDAERVDVLVLDDLHWADPDSLAFVTALMRAAPAAGLLTLLCARPQAGPALARLDPDTTIRLAPMPAEDAGTLARRLGAAPAIAQAATRLAGGNPLYVEHLVAWAAETHTVDGPVPASLHEVVLARISHLESVRLARLRQRASWVPGWMRGDLDAELDAVETDIGLWLDRLESGDYADRATVAEYLARLQRVDFELFITSAMLGRARPRSARLREAIDRLLLSSADVMLAAMQRRADALAGRTDPALTEDAERAAACARDHHAWLLARRFHDLARRHAPDWQQPEILARQAAIDRLLDGPDETALAAREDDIVGELRQDPSVDPVRLPDVWLRLGRRFGDPRMLRRAIDAAAAVGATGLEAAARRAISRLGAPPSPAA